MGAGIWRWAQVTVGLGEDEHRVAVIPGRYVEDDRNVGTFDRQGPGDVGRRFIAIGEAARQREYARNR